jgi:hypothetical protein
MMNGMSPMPTTQLDDTPPDWSFRDAAHEIFPAGTSSRLARVLGVQQRLAQRWLSGEMPPTAEAVEYVRRQQQALKGHNPELSICALVDRWHEAGIDGEVQASHLAHIYETLIDRSIE